MEDRRAIYRRIHYRAEPDRDAIIANLALAWAIRGGPLASAAASMPQSQPDRQASSAVARRSRKRRARSLIRR